MKKIKVRMALFAAIAAVAFSAFTTELPDAKNNLDDGWFEYVGSDNSQGDRANEWNYDLISPQPSSIFLYCPDAIVLCAIKRPIVATSNHPAAFDAIFKAAIESAVTNKLETSNIQLKGQ